MGKDMHCDHIVGFDFDIDDSTGIETAILLHESNMPHGEPFVSFSFCPLCGEPIDMELDWQQ